MPKFVILDPSIVDRTGHYLEYAQRVLSAAKDRGFEPILVTNRRFLSGDNAFRVLPAFSDTVWELYKPQRGLIGSVVAVVRGMRAWLRRRIVAAWRRMFLGASLSDWALAYERARILKSPVDPRLAFFASDWTPTPSSLNLVRFFWAVHWSRGAVRKWVSRAKGAYRRLPRVAQVGGHAMVGLAKLLAMALPGVGLIFLARATLTPLAPSVIGLFVLVPLLSAMFVVLLVWLARRTKSPPSTFNRELRKSLHSLNLERGDIVFIPTCGEIEAAVVSKLCAEKGSAAPQLSWRLLFRREILRGREPTWQSQLSTLDAQRFKMTLAQALRKMQSVDVRWLTDTEGLTRQYNLFGLTKFETAPVPVSAAFEAISGDPSRPVTFGYLGDARTEKGFGLLGEMWDHIVHSAGRNNPPKMLVQSNYNVSGGEPLAVQGKLALEAHPRHSVELIDGPFTSEQYLALFGRLDVVVVPYDPTSYATRSSGVFVEAIKGGLPSIVTNASWMAQLVEPYRQAWLEMIDHRLADASRVTIDRERGRATIGELGAIQWGRPQTHLLFRLEFSRPSPANTYALLLSFLDERGERVAEVEECACVGSTTIRLMARIPANAARVRVRGYAKDLGTSVVPVRITCVSASISKGIPTSFGVRATAPSGRALAHGGEEVLSCIEAYRVSARALKAAWRAYFDDAALMSALIDGGVSPPSGELAAEIVATAKLALPELVRPRFRFDLAWEEGA